MSADFSCIPCNGQACFHLPVVERKTCSEERHLCPYQAEVNDDQEWLCRCCPDCTLACQDDI